MGTDWDEKDRLLQGKYLWGLIDCKEEGKQRTLAASSLELSEVKGKEEEVRDEESCSLATTVQCSCLLE